MSRRYERVIIAVGEDDVAPAAQVGRSLATSGAALMLVHVDTTSRLRRALPGFSEDAATASSMDLLHAARGVIGVPSELVLHHAGSVAEGLHEIAEREAADLIVVAARPDAHLHGVHQVLRGAPSAVAIAPATESGRPPGLSRIGVAFLPTDAGRHGLGVARALAEERGAELHATTVVPVDTSPWLGPAVGAVATLAVVEGTLEQVAKRDLLAMPGVVGHVVEGDPVRGLVRFSEHVDLLVIGTRSIGPLHRLVAGSTAEALSESARCAVLVVADES